MSCCSSLYNVEVSVPSDLSQKDIGRCVDIISKGGATGNSVNQLLPEAELLAIARPCSGGDIVGIGAIKVARPEYAEEIAGKDKSDFPFDVNTTELDFIAVDPSHQNKGIASSIMKELNPIHKGGLFAITDDPNMKKTLEHFNFEQKGKEWKGKRGILSLWIRS